MKKLRTPDSYFANLQDYDFEPNYLMVDDTEGGELRVHYLDEGPSDADPILLLHGEPSWAYLYRKVIPILTAAGHRVIAPDLPGFGRSDKPASRTDYTYQRHVDWMQSVLDQLDLKNITLFCQDWGGLIGLRLVAAQPDKFDRVLSFFIYHPWVRKITVHSGTGVRQSVRSESLGATRLSLVILAIRLSAS